MGGRPSLHLHYLNFVMEHRWDRKRTRLAHYDYSTPGAYFITACTKDRTPLFETTKTKLAVESAWYSVLDIFANIELGEFVVMPNHIHGILWIAGEGAYRLHPGGWKNDSNSTGDLLDASAKIIRSETISNIIGAFKTTAATRINKLRGAPGIPVWQKSFYDRIVRSDRELTRIQEYIRNNPIKWAEDRDNPMNSKFGLPTKSIDDYWIEIFDLHL